MQTEHAQHTGQPGTGRPPTERRPPAGRRIRPLLTRAEYERHRRQLEELRRVRDEDLPRLLRDARTFVSSDAAEEMLQISADQTVADSRIAQLESLLHHAAIVDDDGDSGDVVTLGRLVRVRYTRTGATRTYRVGGVADADRQPYVSARSPVGQALLDRARGDIVTVALPTGATEELLILSVHDGDAPEPEDQQRRRGELAGR